MASCSPAGCNKAGFGSPNCGNVGGEFKEGGWHHAEDKRSFLCRLSWNAGRRAFHSWPLHHTFACQLALQRPVAPVCAVCRQALKDLGNFFLLFMPCFHGMGNTSPSSVGWGQSPAPRKSEAELLLPEAGGPEASDVPAGAEIGSTASNSTKEAAGQGSAGQWPGQEYAQPGELRCPAYISNFFLSLFGEELLHLQPVYRESMVRPCSGPGWHKAIWSSRTWLMAQHL